MKEIPKALQGKWREPHKHRYCPKHIKSNFQAEGFRDKRLTKLFYSTACASEVVEYMKLEKISKQQTGVHMIGLRAV